MSSTPLSSIHPNVKPMVTFTAVSAGICAVGLAYRYIAAHALSPFAILLVLLFSGTSGFFTLVFTFVRPSGHRKLADAKRKAGADVEVLQGTLRSTGEEVRAPLSDRPCLGYDLTAESPHPKPLSLRQSALSRSVLELDGGRGEVVLVDSLLHIDIDYSATHRLFRFEAGVSSMMRAAPSLLVPKPPPGPPPSTVQEALKAIWAPLFEPRVPVQTNEAIVIEGDVVTVLARRAHSTQDRYGAMGAHYRSISGAQVFAFTEAAARSLARAHVILSLATVSAIVASMVTFLLLAR